eukprot:3399282-Rhodomonas_salina.1
MQPPRCTLGAPFSSVETASRARGSPTRIFLRQTVTKQAEEALGIVVEHGLGASRWSNREDDRSQRFLAATAEGPVPPKCALSSACRKSTS